MRDIRAFDCVLAFWQAADAPWLDTRTMILLAVVLGTLAVANLVGWLLTRQPMTSVNPALVRRFNLRLLSWWMMAAILVAGIILGRVATVVLFGLVSFWALREFITATPTRPADHRALFWSFMLFTPLQYVLVGIGRSLHPAYGVDFYGLYAIMIPVYASLAIPARVAMAGDHKRFLERVAKIQAGLLICVYSLSYAPALLDLQLKTWSDEAKDWVPWTGSPAGLLFYFVLMSQLSDVLQFFWGSLLGRHPVAAGIHAGKTWEGLVGGVLSTALLGMLLSFVTPFTLAGAACMSAVIAVMGFAGSITMSAIKRDRGVRDYGTLVQGHAGVLDRIDSVCFAAPVFFHLTRFFLAIWPNLP